MTQFAAYLLLLRSQKRRSLIRQHGAKHSMKRQLTRSRCHACWKGQHTLQTATQLRSKRPKCAFTGSMRLNYITPTAKRPNGRWSICVRGIVYAPRLLMKTNMAAQSQSAFFLMVVTYPRKWLSWGSLSTGRSSQVVNTVILRSRASARNFGLPMHVRKAACMFGKNLTRKRMVKAREMKERPKADTHQQVRLMRCGSLSGSLTSTDSERITTYTQRWF